MAEISTQVSSALDGLTRELNIITHNLANVSTAGYKRMCNSFSNYLAAEGLGAEDGDIVESAVAFDFSQGSVAETGRSLDFALYGKGFFVVETPDGPLYTRNGMFSLNDNGQIVDSSGRTVAGEGGPISIPVNISTSQINVSSDGSISADGAVFGKFSFVDFKDNENQLVSVGASCFAAPEGVVPQEAEDLIVKQGYQEASNVQLVEELVDMIMVTRLYETNMQIVSASKETSSSIIDVAMG